MKNQVSAAQAIGHVKSGMSIMLSGFFSTGSPVGLIRELMNHDATDLTVIANDAASEFMNPNAIGTELIRTGKIKKLICSYSGHNPAAQEYAAKGALEIETIPMGTFVERIRAGGAGLGGFLTPTGLGTEVEKGKRIIQVQGCDYLLEEPLRADIALLYSNMADEDGNINLRGNLKNFAIVMATAADFVIVETREIAKNPIDPDLVNIPAPLVDAIVLIDGGGKHEK